MTQTTTYRLLILALLALAVHPAMAAAHDGHDHDQVGIPDTSVTRQLAADAALAERIDTQSELMAPDAVRGACTTTVDVPEQGPSCLAPNGDWLVELEDGTTARTHGGDQVPAGMLWGSIPTSSATDAAIAGASTSSIQCTTNVRAPHYRLIYARPAGAPDRSGTVIPQFRTEVYRSSAFIQQQALLDAVGVTRRLRVLCSGGVPDVAVELLTVSAASDDFSTIVSELRSRGYNSPEPAQARYLVFYDGVVGPGVWGVDGQAAVTGTSSPDPWGSANNDNLYAIDYADVTGEAHWHTITHEVGHNLGAVQNDAPDSNGSNHCLDSHDVMCYDDGSGTPTVLCPELELDCGSDSYFNAGTPFGWLATHWNAGKPMARFLDHGAQNIDYTLPSQPTAPIAGSATFTTAPFSWTPSLDDVGVTSYRVEISTGNSSGPFVTHSQTAAASRTLTGLTPASTRYVRIRALDAVGNVSDFAALTLSTPADTAAPSVPAGLTVAGATDASIRMAWSSSTDNDQVASYQLERDYGGGSWQVIAGTIASPATEFEVANLEPSTNYTLAVRARDRSGNLSARSASFNAVTAADQSGPTPPTNLRATSGAELVSLYWSPSSDLSGVARYEIEVLSPAGLITATMTTANLITVNVPGGVTYTLRVRAIDTVGNASAYTDVAATPLTSYRPPAIVPPNQTTPVAPVPKPPVVVPAADRIKPTVPARLRLTRTLRTMANIAWNPSRDNVRLRGYRLYVLNARGVMRLHATINGAGARTSAITRLRPGQTYRFRLRAVDTAGNLSTPSAILTVRTPR